MLRFVAVPIYLLPPVLFIEYTPNSLYVFGDGTLVPSFLCTIVPSLLRRGSDPLAKLAAATPKDSTYGLWPQFILGDDPM
jgi:hypothetical protein